MPSSKRIQAMNPGRGAGCIGNRIDLKAYSNDGLFSMAGQEFMCKILRLHERGRCP